MLTEDLKTLAKSGQEFVFDIEASGLIHEYDEVFCICIEVISTGHFLSFHDRPDFTGSYTQLDKDGDTDYTIPERDGTLKDGALFLHLVGNNNGKIIAHNVIAYDKVVLEQTFSKFKVPLEAFHDTLLQSQIQLFDRPPVKGSRGVHGLESYGIRLGLGKPKVLDYKVFTPWLLHRCLVDIEINTKTYHYLERERQDLFDKFGLESLIPLATEQEYAVESINQELHGILADIPHMKACVVDLDKKIEKLRLEVEPQLPLYVKFAGGKKETLNYVAGKLGKKNPPRIKYKYEENADGELEKKAIKSWYVPTDYIWKEVKKNSYEVTFQGKPTGQFFEKIKDARSLIKEYVDAGALKKDYKTIKSVNEFKVPNGNTCKYFEMTEEDCGKILGGPFTKIEVLRPKMTQHGKVKDFLLSLGWIPLEFNFKKKKGKFVRDDRGNLIETTPKLTEESFDSIPAGVGVGIAEYNTYVHRRRYLENSKDDEKGLLNMLRSDGRLSAGIRTFGTATGRGAQTVIVNLPSPKKLYGSEMRKCVIAPKGRVLVSVDMDGSQLRLSADFAGNIEYGESLVVGIEDYTDDSGKTTYVGRDSHTLNCIGFGLATEEQRDEAVRTQDHELIHQMGIARSNGKNGTYATIFGCSGKKLAMMIKVKESTGEARKKAFFDKLGLTGLMAKLVKEWKENKHGKGGYIRTLGNYFVYCQSEHKVLNYFIQGSEAIIQREAIIYAGKKVREECLDAHLVLSVHDEYTYESSEKDANRVAIIIAEAYSTSAKELGVKIKFGGTAKIGKTYYDVH